MRKIIQLLFSYKGRVNRKTYLLYHVCSFGGYYIFAYFFMESLIPKRDSMHPELQYLLEILQYMLGLLGILLLYGTIPVTVKRLHDINRSGWWLLLSSIINLFALILIFGGIGGGFRQQALAFSFYFLWTLLSLIIAFVSFILYCCLPGTKGINNYGEPSE